MPSTLPSGSTFQINIPNFNRTFLAGEEISGTVYLRNSESQSIGTVKICLIGRIKTKIVRRRNDHQNTYRGRVSLIYLPVLLYSGHYTHPPNEFSWPFKITIPERPQPLRDLPDRQSDGPWRRESPWMSTEEQYASDFLPPSFVTNLYGSNEAFIEYKLEATMLEAQNSHSFRGPKEFVTEYSLDICSPGTALPITDFQVQQTQCPVIIRTLKLLPEHADQKLSFRQKTHSLFRPETVPEYKFHLNVEAPRVIQVDNPMPVPFLLSIAPQSFTLPEGGQTTSIADLKFPLPEVTLRRASITLRSLISYRCSPTAFNWTPHDSHKNDRSILSVDFRDSGPNRIVLPQTGILDLSTVFPQLFSLASQGTRSGFVGMVPNFASSIISVQYYWKWNIEVECAGKHEDNTSNYAAKGTFVTVLSTARNKSSTSPPYLSSASGPAPAYSSSSTDPLVMSAAVPTGNPGIVAPEGTNDLPVVPSTEDGFAFSPSSPTTPQVGNPGGPHRGDTLPAYEG